MTMNVTGVKARLLATTVAASLLAMAAPANAQVAAGGFNGKYKASVWAVKKEGAGAPKPDTRTAAQKLADEIALAQKTETKNLILAGLTGASDAAYTDYKDAVADVAEKEEAIDLLLNNTVAGGPLGLNVLKAKLTEASAKLDLEEAALTDAETKRDAAEDKFDAASEALLDLDTDATDAQIAAATQAKAVAEAELAIANEAVDQLESKVAATSLLINEDVDGLADLVRAAQVAVDESVDELAPLTRALRTATVDLNDALADDDGFLANLAAINAAAGTNFSATAAGLEAIEEYNTAPAGAKYASNGYTRATDILTAAAASANGNISMASGALTGSAAALEAGANFETEVLGALVNHEVRITSNTTAIAALDVRTTANTTAIAALDVRTTANTTAIAALDVRTTANTTAIANEVTARVAADNALGARITAETDARIAADNVLRDQIASSTATAIAMGGAALLPDMGFTLSGNIAVYEGAQAMALNAAAKVGANAFVTASVGGGLNKNGSVGGRVGFVFGF